MVSVPPGRTTPALEARNQSWNAGLGDLVVRQVVLLAGELVGHQHQGEQAAVGLLGVGMAELESAPVGMVGDRPPAARFLHRLGHRPEADLGYFLRNASWRLSHITKTIGVSTRFSALRIGDLPCFARHSRSKVSR